MMPARGCVFVTPVSTEERQAGGLIIIPESAREKLASHQMIIKAVGEPEICEDEQECERACHEYICSLTVPGTYPMPVHPTDERIKPDAWCIVRPRALVEISAQDKLFSVRQSEVIGVFTDE